MPLCHVSLCLLPVGTRGNREARLFHIPLPAPGRSAKLHFSHRFSIHSFPIPSGKWNHRMRARRKSATQRTFVSLKSVPPDLARWTIFLAPFGAPVGGGLGVRLAWSYITATKTSTRMRFPEWVAVTRLLIFMCFPLSTTISIFYEC